MRRGYSLCYKDDKMKKKPQKQNNKQSITNDNPAKYEFWANRNHTYDQISTRFQRVSKRFLESSPELEISPILYSPNHESQDQTTANRAGKKP